jgi:hypothetical protein
MFNLTNINENNFFEKKNLFFSIVLLIISVLLFFTVTNLAINVFNYYVSNDIERNYMGELLFVMLFIAPGLLFVVTILFLTKNILDFFLLKNSQYKDKEKSPTYGLTIVFSAILTAIFLIFIFNTYMDEIEFEKIHINTIFDDYNRLSPTEYL